MHVAFDLVFLVPGASGGRETYARELLRALRELDGGLRMTCLINRETAAAAAPGFWSEVADRVAVLPRASGAERGRWAIGELAAVPRAAARAGADVLHAPANFGPVAGPFARVLTLHDLLYRERPELVPPAVRLITRALLEPAAHRAHRVITVSRASAAAIERELRLPPERVAVVPNGIAPPPQAERAAERDGVLAVATHLPHKNLDGLLAALATMDPRPRLTVAGHGTEALAGRAEALGVTGEVRLLGAVGADELEALYAAAGALVTTTLSEGFGLPVLEAMARGVPVACSDLPVLREVAGDAVTYLDPRSPASIAAAIRTALASDGAAGRARTAAFTWRAAAERTVEVYEAALRSTTANTRFV